MKRILKALMASLILASCAVQASEPKFQEYIEYIQQNIEQMCFVKTGLDSQKLQVNAYIIGNLSLMVLEYIKEDGKTYYRSLAGDFKEMVGDHAQEMFNKVEKYYRERYSVNNRLSSLDIRITQDMPIFGLIASLYDFPYDLDNGPIQPKESELILTVTALATELSGVSEAEAVKPTAASLSSR